MPSHDHKRAKLQGKVRVAKLAGFGMAGAILSARIMKIAIAYDVAYPYRHGGGEKRNWEIARRLAALGHETWLVSMQM